MSSISAPYKITRTLRCKNLNIPGTLGKLTSTIGRLGAEIGNITTLNLGMRNTVRDIQIIANNEAQLEDIVKAVSAIPEITLLEVRDEVLDFHKGGKIKTVSTINVNSVDVLRKIYTPGVAEVCKLIATDPSYKNTYTCIPNTIAIVTDGSRVLGLSNIGPVAAMPVMEGKSALLYSMVGVSGVPILLNTQNQDEIIETVKHIAPTFGAIHLEDIESPKCFAIQERLEKELDIPVMHDDQYGTAVVTLAALINVCNMQHMNIKAARVGLIGLGAAGLTIGKLFFQYSGNPALGTARSAGSIKRHVDAGGVASTFDEVMKSADIVVATSGIRGLISPEMIRKGQIIFALSNPYPEIEPELAIEHGAAIAIDGRALNNVVAYPGIWRGTLDSMATKITPEMYKAAALAIAASAEEGELVPNPLVQKVHLAVTHEVARAAIKSGVAKRVLDDDYFENKNIKRDLWV